MGDELIKYYVCTYNKWNPYSEEIKNIPDIYWMIQFQMVQLANKRLWEDFYRPSAELTGQITNPQVFKAYYDHMRRQERRKKEKEKAGKDSSFYYENKEKDMNSEYTYSEAEANAHYDPTLGFVDEKGKVIIPKDECDSMIGFDGAMISY